jgi:hypothetical protein
MAIAKVADRGTASSNSAVTAPTIAVSGTTVGNYILIRTAADNSGGGGAARSLTVTDTGGNTYTGYQQNNDPGAASAGTTCNVVVAKITAAPGTITLTYSGAVVQAAVVEEWSGIDATTPVVGTPVGANGVASTNMASCADTSVAVDNLAYGVQAIEGPSTDVFTQDADTTNGSWTDLTKLGTTNVTATDNQTVYGAYKVVTATGAQTYNPTIVATARDTAGLILELAAEVVVNATASPGVIAAIGALPAATAGVSADATPAASAATAALPAVAPSAGSTPTPATVAATSALPAPTLSAGSTPTPDVLAASATLPPVTASGGTSATASPVTLAVVASLPAPVVTASGFASPLVLAVSVAMPGATATVYVAPVPASSSWTVTAPNRSSSTAAAVTVSATVAAPSASSSSTAARP